MCLQCLDRIPRVQLQLASPRITSQLQTFVRGLFTKNSSNFGFYACVHVFLFPNCLAVFHIMGLPTFHFQESFNWAHKYNMIISSKFADSIQRRNAMVNAMRFTGTAA